MTSLIEDEFKEPPADWALIEKQKLMGWSFKPESMAELLARPEPGISWLIDSLWVDKARGFIAGNPNIGKTWLALEMLMSVSTGLPCLGQYAVRQGPVLLVEEESSVENLSRRIHALAKDRNYDLSNFHHITRQSLKIIKHEKELIAFIKARGIVLVVFDSLRRFHGFDENSSEKMQPVLDAFGRIGSETGASVVLIHHLAKQSGQSKDMRSAFERMRGTSDFWAWRDCIIAVEGEEGSDITSCSFQFRDAEAPAPVSVRRLSDGSSIRLQAVSVLESPEFMAKVEEAKSYLISKFDVAYPTHIAKAMKGRKGDNLKALKVMVKNGILEELDGGKYGLVK